MTAEPSVCDEPGSPAQASGQASAGLDAAADSAHPQIILEALPDPLVVLTHELRVSSANPAFYSCFEVTPEQTLSHEIYELGNGQWNIPSLRHLLEQVLANDDQFSGYQVEHTFERIGRRVMRLDARRVARRDLILLVLHDVTESHDAEQARHQSEQRLRKMFDVEGVSVMVFDETAGTMVDANDAFLESMGYSREELEAGALSWQQMTPPEYVQASGEQLLKLERTGRIGPYEKEYIRKDGSRVWMLFAGASFGDGTLVEYGIDISDRKRLEKDLRLASVRKDEYLAMLGHELRNPLAAIRHALDLIELTAVQDPLVSQACRVLERQSSHMARLVDGLVDGARIARGKVELRLETIDLRSVLEPLLGDRETDLTNTGVQLELELPTQPLWICGDRVRLTQIFDNLIANAINFTPPPGSITVTLTREDDQALICVRDTGVGIDAQSLSLVFEPFHQGPQGVDRHTGGLGLGLALARGLVELHQGSIEARSEGPGTGTEVRVHLPLAAALVTPDPRYAEPTAAACNQRILLVEDNADAAEMLGCLLERLGYEVELADNGRAALAALRAREADVVLCDLGLPGMSGLEVARAIREDPALRRIPLIALTGYGQASDRDETRAAGFDEHLTKPVCIEILTGVIARLTGVARTRH